MQLLANERSRLAALALRRLCGADGSDAPRNHAVTSAVTRLLTGYLAGLLDDEDQAPTLLRLLNSASETPYLIWNATLRAELVEVGAPNPCAASRRCGPPGVTTAPPWRHHRDACNHRSPRQVLEGLIAKTYASPESAPLSDVDSLVFEALKPELKVGAVRMRACTTRSLTQTLTLTLTLTGGHRLRARVQLAPGLPAA